MRHLQKIRFRGLLWAIVAILSALVVAVVAYVGYGRLWGQADAVDIRLAITSRLRSIPAYRHYAQDLLRTDGARPTIYIIPQESSDEDEGKVVHRINGAAGSISDGHYHAALVALTTFHNQLLKQPVGLADYLGAVEFRIRNGQLYMMSFNVGELAKAKLLHARLASILNAIPREELESKYPHAKLDLLDGCDFRTAKHIERLFANFAGWPEFATQRLIHAGFVARLRKSGNYYSRGAFALTSGWRFGLPQALTFGDDQSCRVCVLATTMNSFGEPLDEAQTIVALEQVDGHSTVVHEVLRVDAGEFDADAVNGLLVGHFAYPWIKIIAGVAIVVVLLVVLRFLLGIFVQVKYLLPDAPRSAMMDGANISGANATATPESNQS